MKNDHKIEWMIVTIGMKKFEMFVHAMKIPNLVAWSGHRGGAKDARHAAAESQTQIAQEGYGPRERRNC